MDEPSGNKLSERVIFLILGGLIFPLIIAVILSSHEGKKDKDTSEPKEDSPKQTGKLGAAEPDREFAKKAVKTVAPEDAKKFVGEYCTIEMIVQAASKSKKGTVWLLNSERNFRNSNNFTVMVGEAVTKELAEKRKWEATSFVGKRVRVSGKVKVYQDRPEVVINEMTQLEIIR